MSNKVVSAILATFFLFFPIIAFYSQQETTLVPAQTVVVAEGKAECVMELQSRRILYAKNDTAPLPIASTTKIVTAAAVLESNKNLQETICIPKEAEGVEGSSVYLKCGDLYTIEELLYGLLLRSGNDCATALALHSSGSLAMFSNKMNDIAKRAGAIDSCFKNPHGLPQEGHYSTARDLCLITSFAYQNPIFREIVATKYYEKQHWKNKNKLLTLYEGGIGVKTGYTKQAGRCLVSAATRENMTLICSLLNCPTTYERTMNLFDDAFEHYKNTVVLAQNTVFELNDGKQTCLGYSKEEFVYPLLQEELDWIEIKASPISSFPSRKNSEKIVGKFEIYLAKDLLFSGKLYKL